ncbi:MAG: 4Fe-4S dicluster domain-containing protein [Planctomycetota bacterium]|jgi:molybdopterin-containing oxidoreductase family iron-sulfur binding subunit
MSRRRHDEEARKARRLPIQGSAGGACASGSCGCGSAAAGSASGAADTLGSNGNGTSRRDFLKVLGVGGAGAAAIGCGPPDFADTLITQLVQPEEVIPGRNDTYATALGEAGPEPLGIHATVRDGRVIKLEGNPSFPTNRGRLSGLAQSVLQDLYDPDRIPNPRRRRGDAPAGEETAGEAYEDVDWDAALAAAAAALGQGSTVLLTGGVTGTSARFFAEWAEATGAEHVAYEAFEYGALRAAHEIAFGTAAIPTYAIDRADRIVSFGADFLGTWLAPVELAGRYAQARAIDEGRHAKFTFVGPRLSVTGSNADEWLSVRAGTEGLVALAVAHDVAGRRGVVELAAVLAPYSPEAVAETAGVPVERIEQLAEELAAAESPIALPPGIEGQGSRATEAHLAVALLNHACGAIGRTVELDDTPVRPSTASFDEMRDLIDRMNRGQVRTLIVSGANPAFTLPRSAAFAEALANVPSVIAIHPHLDETAAVAGWLLPCHHALESWGDVEARPGVRALAQPVMRPVFDTRQREDILLQIATIAGRADGFEAETFADYLKETWRELLGTAADSEDDWWLGALRGGGTHALEVEASEGVPADVPPPAQEPARAPALTTAAQSYMFGAFEPPAGDALLVYPSVHFYDGRGANRAWMQEVPDPVTRNVWNSWVELHPDMAERLGVEHGDVVAVRSEAGSVEAPVSVNRGIRSDTVAIPIGQGHTHYGRNAAGRGVNPLDLLPPVRDPGSGALAFAGVSVSVEPVGRSALLVSTQGSESDLGREIAELLNVDEAREAIEARAAEDVDTSEPHVLAWDTDPKSPYRWAMTIDLNSCTGCGACVTACYAENNIHTVGEDQVAARREMSWLRVYRFYEETEDDGFQVVHTPMLCQHCGDAPCEPVCPVYATYHNPEGLNVQVYNRCVGTRYCANNCPYKVRRFNWFDYEHPYPLNLQLNPDVTVRQKGVMEKCTFCVHRINRARVDAKDEGRFVEDGEVMTACQQGCPTQAIAFGNLKDPNSRVSQVARGARAYQALSELGVRPGITYLKGVTHAEPVHEEHGHGGEYEGGEEAGAAQGAEHGEEEGH